MNATAVASVIAVANANANGDSDVSVIAGVAEKNSVLVTVGKESGAIGVQCAEYFCFEGY